MTSPTTTPEKPVKERPKSIVARFAAQLAEQFGVREDEAAILRLRDGALTFVHPEELQKLMSIPVSCTRSVAGRTALTRQSEMYNNFVNIPHMEIFEQLKLKGMKQDQSRTIQKLMSVAVLDKKEVLGVLQICRKADTPFAAGPDFSARDLYRLEVLAKGACELLR